MVLGQGPRHPVRPGSIGRPLPTTSVAVCNDSYDELPAGEIGRLLIAADSPGFFLGYHRDEAMTRQVHYFLVWGPLLVLSLALVAGQAWARFHRPVQRWLNAERVWLRRSVYPNRSRWYKSTAFWTVALPLIPFIAWMGVELGLTAVDTTIGLRFGERSLGGAFLAIGSQK